MELVEMQKTAKHDNWLNFECDSYDSSSFSMQLYEDPLQTVPDLEELTMKGFPSCLYTAQQVPSKRQQCVPSEDETTPVRLDGLYSKTCSITPRALKFEDDDSEVPTSPRKGKSTKKRKTKRRSYLSYDLPEEVRNQRRTVANARERARVGRMANGYDALQKVLPEKFTTNKMRKVDILNAAVCHIHNLMGILSQDRYECSNDKPLGILPFPSFLENQSYTGLYQDIDQNNLIMLQYSVNN